MSISRVRRAFFRRGDLVCGVAVAALGLGAAGFAQQSSQQSSGTSSTGGEASSSGSLSLAPAEVVASRLDDVDPMLIGVLTPQEGGLPGTLWRGSDRESVADAASRTPGESGFRAAADLAARALMSGGAAPPPPGDTRTTALERLEALLRLGRLDAVDALVTRTPNGLNDPQVAAVAVRARLAKNEVGSACGVADALEQGRDGAFWLRLRSACYAWADEGAAAALTLDLAREADETIADQGFTNWVFAAADGRAPRNAEPPRGPLEAALALSAGYGFAGDALDRVDLPLVVGLALNDEVDAGLRARAALRAASAGAVTADALAEALSDLQTPELNDVGARLAAGGAADRPLADAILREAVLLEGASTEETASALDAALARAETPAEFIVLAHTLAEPLAALPASPDLARPAPRFALAAAALGDRTLAHRWLDPRPARAPASGAAAGFDGFNALFASEPDFSNSPLDPAERVAAEAVVTAADPRASYVGMRNVAEARLESVAEADVVAQAAARRDALILLALGADSAPSLRRAATTAIEEADLVGDIVGQALNEARLASRSGAAGETALYVAEALGEAGPGHAPTAAAAIEILRAAGLSEDARAVAVEAMLASRVGRPLAIAN